MPATVLTGRTKPDVPPTFGCHEFVINRCYNSGGGENIVGQLDEVEYARLAAQVLEIEKLVNSGQSGKDGFLLRTFLHNAKLRMEEIQHQELLAEETKNERKEKEAATVVRLAEMEHQLSAGEKEQYSAFLTQEYFTKKNFADLEAFYADAWDRLSEGGKNQMSSRVWGGIRRQEYTFEDLPEKVREKESERIYLQLTGMTEPSSSLQRVSPQTRAEFVREYQAGHEKAASKILSGEDFAGYSPDTRTEAPLRDASLSKEKKSAEQAPVHGPQVTTTEDVALDGFTLTEADAVPATSLPPSGGKPLGKG